MSAIRSTTRRPTWHAFAVLLGLLWHGFILLACEGGSVLTAARVPRSYNGDIRWFLGGGEDEGAPEAMTSLPR